MSGIFGLFRRDGRPVEPAELAAMGAMLRHRGPDGLATWSEGPVGLGVRMLWTTPEAHAEPTPYRSVDGAATLVYDGRVDNREELAAALGLDASRLSATGDGELLLSAWQRWGAACVDHVIGDFAFAVFDAREQRLMLFRDRFGVRPLFYHLSDRLCAFGTEIKPLLCLTEIPLELDDQRIAAHLLRTFWEVESTFYRAIRRLPPAHRLTVGRESTGLERYWRLDPERNVMMSSDEEYAEAFRELFTEAVRCRVRGVGEVGSTLSGGLDSSSVACTAAALLAQRGAPALHTFSGVFDHAWRSDEREYINAVVEHCRVVPHLIVADEVSPLLDIDRVSWHMEEPFFTPHMSMDWLIFGAAKDAGVRVLLTGFDGDTVVGHGYAYQTELLRSWHPIRFVRLARQVAGVVDVSPRELYWRRGLKPLAPDAVLRSWHALRRQRRSDTLFNADFAERCGFERLQRRNMRIPYRTERAEHLAALGADIMPFAMESSSRASGAHGVELRHPFFDVRLAEYCLALPSLQKIRGPITRVVLRNAMRGLVPDRIVDRPGKAGLGDAFMHKLLYYESDRLRELVAQPGAIEEFIDRGQLRRYHQALEGTRAVRPALELWVALMLSIGLEAMERTAAEARRAAAEGRLTVERSMD